MPLLKGTASSTTTASSAGGESSGSDPAPNPGKETKPPLQLVKPKRRELNALEREFLPPLLELQETPPSPTKRLLLWTLIALVIVLITWASVGQISIVSTAPGKFIPDGRVKQLQPMETAIIKAIHVKEGQHVEQGELLLELDPTINAAELKANTEKYALNQLEQSRLSAELGTAPTRGSHIAASKEQIALANRTRTAREQSYASKLAEAQAALQEKTSAVESAQATLRKYQETTEIAQEREASARPLLENGAISRLDYLQLKQDLATNQNDLAAQEKNLAQADAAKIEAEHKLAATRRDHVTDIYTDLNKDVDTAPALKGDLDKAQQLYNLKWLRAPVSGTVQRIDVSTLGQVVTPAQNLITIVPDGTPLVVEATLSNQDIGYVKVGQPVEIKVDTFPFQKYGSLKGTLTWISADAEDKNAASSDTDTRSGAPTSDSSKAQANPNGAGYVYKVYIRPDTTSFTVHGQSTPIQAGMTVQADVVTDHRRVIEFFLSPVTKYLDEGLTVR
jgi:hemolysin D